jgi:carboxyl-terminal processing protease
MMRLLNRMALGVVCLVWLSLGMSCQSASEASAAPAHAPAAPAQTQPSPMDPAALESAAVDAAQTGDFAQSDDYLQRAAHITRDPQLAEMMDWINQFETQEQIFAGERHTQFEQAVANVHTLLANKMDGYALDEAAQAYLLADNKDEFRHEKWIDDLVNESAKTAQADETGGLWLKALRLYEDLGQLDPATPEWKDKLKLVTLRVRLLLVYAPDRMTKLEKGEKVDRQAADDLLKASTQPSTAMGSTTRPTVAMGSTTQPDDDDVDAPPTDWHEVTRGIQFDMLVSALDLAAQQYYRDVTFQNLLQGGLNGLKAVLTTDGLQDAFPGLKDVQKRDEFLQVIDKCQTAADLATPDDAADITEQCLNDLRAENDKSVKLPEEVFVSEFADGAFSKLDVFSTIIWPYDVEELNKTTEGEFGGVGIQIEPDDAGNIKVDQPLEDTPAARAGIRPGDVIIKINGKSAKGMGKLIETAVRMITGEPGTNVTLTVRSVNGDVKDYVLRREMIKVASIKGCVPTNDGGWDYMLDPEDKIGYIRITSFSKTTSDDLGKALDDLKGEDARAIILDLRSNPGGLLQSAKEVVNKFLDKGVIVSTHADRKTINAPTVMDADPQDLQTTLPLIVLVNQYSASASEIVSGALKDQKRALIVGERTYGKGSVQMLFPLDTKDAYLKLTTSHYYLPSGRCIHREENSTTWGVDPNVTIEMTPRQMIERDVARRDLDISDTVAAEMPGEPTTRPTVKDLLKVDPQLSAALLIMRLQLALEPSGSNQSAMR